MVQANSIDDNELRDGLIDLFFSYAKVFPAKICVLCQEPLKDTTWMTFVHPTFKTKKVRVHSHCRNKVLGGS